MTSVPAMWCCTVAEVNRVSGGSTVIDMDGRASSVVISVPDAAVQLQAGTLSGPTVPPPAQAGPPPPPGSQAASAPAVAPATVEATPGADVQVAIKSPHQAATATARRPAKTLNAAAEVSDKTYR